MIPMEEMGQIHDRLGLKHRHSYDEALYDVLQAMITRLEFLEAQIHNIHNPLD